MKDRFEERKKKIVIVFFESFSFLIKAIKQ